MILFAMSSSSAKLDTIQALRGIAAGLIVVMHGFYESGLPKPAFFPFHIGVDIFFVISGFIMVYTSRNLFGAKGAWKIFMARRLVRIVPVYWFYTTLLVVVALIMPSVLQTVEFEPVHVVLSYFFIPHENLSGSLHPFLDLGWTLNYEMYFYAVFAAMLFLPMRVMLFSLSAFFVLSVIAGFFIPEENSALYFWTRSIVLEFVGGAWIGYAFLSGRRISGGAGVTFGFIAVVLLFLDYNIDGQRAINLELAAVLLVAAAILPFRMEKLAVQGWLLGLGDASYTIYLAHPFILAALALVLRGFLDPWAVFGISVPAALIGGYILYFLIEKPLLSVTKRVFLRA